MITTACWAIGQYENYRLSLSEIDPSHTVWLAIPNDAWKNFFQRPFIQKAIKHYQIELIIFDPNNETILQWIK